MPGNHYSNSNRINSNVRSSVKVERKPQSSVESHSQVEYRKQPEVFEGGNDQMTGKLIFSPPDPELFNQVARQRAEVVNENRGCNKPSQIRKFYDELCMWETKVSQEPAKFNDYLPFILMLNAKLAYAKGRKLVDESFTQMIGDCLKQVKDEKSLRICKLFFEAFLGFYKELRPSDK